MSQVINPPVAVSDPIFGENITYVESLSQTQIGITGTWASKLLLTTPSLITGVYRVTYTCRVWSAVSNGNIATEILQDGSISIITSSKEPKDTDDRLIVTGYIEIPLTGVHTFDLRFQKTKGGGTVFISDARLEIFRVS